MKIHDDLEAAIRTNDAAALQRLLAAHPELANCPDWTPPPLHCAIMWDKPEMAAVLMDGGADLELRDPDRDTTPLRYAVMYARHALIPLLLARGADSGATEEGGRTALQLARHAAAGGFEEFSDLPRPEAYGRIVEMLRELGVQ